MKIKFIKDHPSGIKEGNTHDVDEKFATRMIEGEFAEPADDQETKSKETKSKDKK